MVVVTRDALVRMLVAGASGERGRWLSQRMAHAVALYVHRHGIYPMGADQLRSRGHRLLLLGCGCLARRGRDRNPGKEHQSRSNPMHGRPTRRGPCLEVLRRLAMQTWGGVTANYPIASIGWLLSAASCSLRDARQTFETGGGFWLRNGVGPAAAPARARNGTPDTTCHGMRWLTGYLSCTDARSPVC